MIYIYFMYFYKDKKWDKSHSYQSSMTLSGGKMALKEIPIIRVLRVKKAGNARVYSISRDLRV